MNALQRQEVQAPEDAARSDIYAVLAALLGAPPSAALLELIAGADDIAAHSASEPPLAGAWRNLQAAAAIADAEALQTEYGALFFAVGEPEVMLYASWYRTGFLMEEPLARVRADLARLGLSRLQSVNEPEDHIAALCETMRLLVSETLAPDAAHLAVQKRFFARHIAPWHAELTQRIEQAAGANFYRCVAALMKSFFEAEAAHFEHFAEEPDADAAN
ncbi:MAG: molecular chaperone TorD family protein [Burkholderiales bacterium]